MLHANSSEITKKNKRTILKNVAIFVEREPFALRYKVGRLFLSQGNLQIAPAALLAVWNIANPESALCSVPR